MTRSPYAPPTARVSDPPQVRGPAPTAVRRAAQFLWASFVLSVALGGMYLVGAVPSPSLVVDVATTLLTAAVIALIAAKVRAGRNWARWVFVAMYIFGSVMFALLFIVMPQEFLSLPGPMQVLGLLQFTLQTCALVLMFTPASRQWFRALHAAASPSAS